MARYGVYTGLQQAPLQAFQSINQFSQALRNVEAIGEMKDQAAIRKVQAAQIQKQIEFDESPVGLDKVIGMGTDMKPKGKAEEFTRGFFSQFSKDGQTITNGDLSRAGKILEQPHMKMQFLKAHLADADEHYKEILDKRESLREKYYGKEWDDKGKEQMEEINQSLDYAGRTRFAIRAKLSGVSDAFQQQSIMEREEMKARQRAQAAAEETARKEKADRDKASSDLIKALAAQTRANRPPGAGKAPKAEGTYDVTYGGKTYSGLSPWPGQTLRESYPDIPADAVITKTGTTKTGGGGRAPLTLGPKPATSAGVPVSTQGQPQIIPGS